MKKMIVLFALCAAAFGLSLAVPEPQRIECGLAPIPPIGCTAQCFCETDKNGVVYCSWQFRCK